MKTRCSPAFAATLAAVQLTYPEWCVLARRAQGQQTRRVRQFVRQVQRMHTGRGMWRGGVYVRKEASLA